MRCRQWRSGCGCHAKTSAASPELLLRLSALSTPIDSNSDGDGDIDAETLRRWLWTCDDTAAAVEVAGAIAGETRVHRFAEAVTRLQAREQTGEVRFLDGDTIMSVLGVGPGPQVGQAHKLLQANYFARGPLTDDEQVQVLLDWSASQSGLIARGLRARSGLVAGGHEQWFVASALATSPKRFVPPSGRPPGFPPRSTGGSVSSPCGDIGSADSERVR